VANLAAIAGECNAAKPACRYSEAYQKNTKINRKPTGKDLPTP
jgi:hypothetical protein